MIQHPFLGRVAASVAAVIVAYLLDLLGLPVSEDQKAGIVSWLTEGLTALGGFVILLVYGLVHKTVNKKLNPADTAVP